MGAKRQIQNDQLASIQRSSIAVVLRSERCKRIKKPECRIRAEVNTLTFP